MSYNKRVGKRTRGPSREPRRQYARANTTQAEIQDRKIRRARNKDPKTWPARRASYSRHGYPLQLYLVLKAKHG